MKKLLILILILSGLNSYAQELTCKDFMNGEFLIPADSLVPISYKILRSNSKQIEIGEDGIKTVINIKYIDDCNYILTYNSEENDYDELSEYINASGGVKVQVLEIKGDTLIYSGLVKNDSLNYEMTGKMIKLK